MFARGARTVRRVTGRFARCPPCLRVAPDPLLRGNGGGLASGTPPMQVPLHAPVAQLDRAADFEFVGEVSGEAPSHLEGTITGALEDSGGLVGITSGSLVAKR